MTTVNEYTEMRNLLYAALSRVQSASHISSSTQILRALATLTHYPPTIGSDRPPPPATLVSLSTVIDRFFSSTFIPTFILLLRFSTLSSSPPRLALSLSSSPP